MITVIGQVADRLGHCQWGDGAVEVIPADAYRSAQPARIPLDLDHDGVAIGEVIALEERDGALWAVATSAVDELAKLTAPAYFSPLVRHRNGSDAELLAVALTYATAAVGQIPVSIVAGPPADAALELRFGTPVRDLIEHAVAYDHDRRDRAVSIRIARPRPVVPEWRRSDLPPDKVEWARGGGVIAVR